MSDDGHTFEVPDTRDVSTEDWEARREADLLEQFGDSGVAEIEALSDKYEDPDDAVRAYRSALRARGEGEPL